jgi:hypothetical protein
MQGRGNARFPCTPSPKPTSTTNKNRLAARTGKKLGCGNDVRWNPWKSPTPTFPPLPPHLEIPQQTRDSHIPTATTTTGYRGLDQHQTKFNTKINTNNKTKVVYTDNLTHPITDAGFLPASVCVVGSQGPPFSVTQLTSYFNPLPTADPRTRGSVRRASGFVQIPITLKMATGDNHLLLMRRIGRVMVGDQSPALLLLYPHSGKASVVGNRLAFILPIHC